MWYILPKLHLILHHDRVFFTIALVRFLPNRYINLFPSLRLCAAVARGAGEFLKG